MQTFESKVFIQESKVDNLFHTHRVKLHKRERLKIRLTKEWASLIQTYIYIRDSKGVQLRSLDMRTTTH